MKYQLGINQISIEDFKKHYGNRARDQNCIAYNFNNPPASELKHFIARNADGENALDQQSKILIACDYFWPSIGGSELFVEEIATRLIDEGYKVDVATRWLKNRTDTIHNQIKIFQFKCGGNLNEGPRGEIEEYRNLITGGNYDTVIILGHPDLWVGLGIVNLPKQRPRIIFLPSINAENILNWRNGNLFRQASEILASADSLITVSESGYDTKFLEAVGLTHTFIPHAVEQKAASERFRIAYAIPDGLPLLVMVANYWPVKNHMALLHVLANSPGNWRLFLIGYPISSQMQYFFQVKELVARDHRIRFIDGLPPDKAASAIRDADLLLIPSKGESAGPLVLLQAMSFATPWIATPECNAVNDEAGGVVVPLEHFPELIERMLTFPEISRRLGLLGQEHWRSSFTWERVWPALKNIIENGRVTVDLSMTHTIRDKNNTIVKELLSAHDQVTKKNEHRSKNPVKFKERSNCGSAVLMDIEANGDNIPHPDAALPMVSVVVPTYNRAPILVDFLAAIETQNYPHDRFEVIICDDGSKDETATVIQTFQSTFPLMYLHQQKSGPAAARNRALEKATGAIVLIMNDDAIAAPDLILSHVKTHVRMKGQKTAVLGSLSFADDNITTALMYLLQNSDILFQFSRMKPLERYDFGYFWTCNISIERKAFVEAGLFDEDFKEAAGEDIELGYRLVQKGYSVLYDPSCRAIHKHTINFNSFCRRQVSVGRNSILVALKHPEIARHVTGLTSIEHAERDVIAWYHENVNAACQAVGFINRINTSSNAQAAQILAGATQISEHIGLVNQFWLYQGFLDGLSRHFFHRKTPKSKLRITFITPGTSISGGVKIILEYCNRLAGRGHTVNLISMNKGYPDWIGLNPAINFSVVDWHDDNKQITQELPDADVLIATQWFTAYFVAGIPSSKGIKYYLVQDYESQTITTPENADPTYMLPLRKIVVSSWLGNLLKERFGQQSEYIRNAIDTTVLFPDPAIRLRSPAEQIRIGMLWHTEPRKGTRSGIEAFELVKQRYPDARLILFGTTEPQNIRCDEFHKNITGAEVRNYFSSLDFFVSTSMQEGFGLPGLEAMACGVPLVTTDSGGITDYAVNCETALVVAPRDAAAIAKALIHLETNRDLCESFRQTALAKAAEFSWDASVTAMEDVLLEATSGASETAIAPISDNRVTLARSPAHKCLKVTVFSFDSKEHACGHYRIQAPLKEIAGEVELSWGIEVSEKAFRIIPGVAEAADIIIVQRSFPRLESTDFLYYLCSLGKPIIFEIDDLLTQLPPTNLNYSWGMDCTPHIYEFIRKCSAVTVSTEELKKHFSSYNDAIHILPNLLDSDLWCKTSPPSSGPVVIGYAGTITHNTDLALLEEVLDRIASSYGNRVTFTFIGCATERISRLPGFSYIQFKNSFEAYARELQEIPIDIMLVPLEDNPFNRCKSNIKWLEYSSCGIAGIYADLPSYNNCIEHGTTGLLAGSDPQQWFNAIDLLIRNSKLRRSIAMNARQKVMAEHTLKVGAQRWLKVYREIISMHAAQNATTAGDLSVPSKIDLDISNITTEKTLPQIGILCSDPLTCSCPAIRLISPLKDLQESKLVKYVDITPLFQGTTDVLLQQLKNIDILVVQRDVSWKIPYSNLKQLLDRLNIKLVFEFDDAMTLLPTTNPHYDHYLNRRHFFEEYVRHADLITVSTEQLRSLYSYLNPRIAVIPNCLDMTIWQGCPIKHPRTSSPLKILFSGTPTHVSDFMVLLGAIQRILAEFPERVELYLWGSQIAALQGHPQVHYVEKFFPNYYDYARILKSLNADIGVIPLEDNIFNRAKSCIKWLEYSACGIASICSDSDAYNTIVRHGKTGLLVKNEEAIWYKAIKELVLDDNLRFAIARNARLDVEQNHTISKNAHKWIDAYSLLLETTVDQSDRVNTVERSCGNSPALLLSIIIPLYNGVAFTRRCLDSLSVHADPTLYELILVDNASSDATSHLLNSLPPSATIIRNATNLGFAHACNQGAWVATTPYILFLNNDTVVTPGWLETMIEACGPDVGIIGCRMLYPDGTIQHAGIELINGIPDHPYRHQPADMPAANIPRDLDMVTGACLLIRRELFLQLAGFDEVYRNGVEDVDLCLRAREAGYRVVYQPKAMIYHHEGQSSGRFDHVDRNLRFFIDRWQGKFDKKDRFIASNPPVLMTAEKSYINEQPLHVVWQGSQFVYHSLALINREMCRRLIQIGHELSIVPYEQDEFFPEPGSPLAAIQECVNRPLSQPADVVVRHQWPPDFNPPPAGHWVMIQPWEFGSIPLSWIGPMNEELDEIWVPSSYVRACYIQSGVSCDKVFVVPNGVDTALYSPVGATYPIASGKSFRFLFVGGTIYRKGIDLLLAAYRQSFTAQDDVCLVIKDMGGKSFYQGQTAQEMIQRFSADPAAPEIVYIDSNLTSDEMAALYRSCHCLVHPYRGEGFGLPIAEAMASGLSVIVTGYGAALDFCPPDIAWLVSAQEVRFATWRVGDIDTVGLPWLAEPDLNVLSDRMRHAFNHPDEARRRGQAACEHIRRHFTWDHAAQCVEARLQALRDRPVVRFTKEKMTPRAADKADTPADDEAKRRDLAAKVMEQARVLQLHGETETAVSMLIQQGIGVAPDCPASYLALAELLMGEQRFADAMQVVQEMPPDAERTVVREIEAICHAALGDDEAARKSANRVPERPRALVVLGTLAARQGDLAGAEALFRRAIGVDASCGSAWLSLGMLLWGHGKQADAWQAVKRSVVVDPLNGEAVKIMKDMAERLDQVEKQL